MKEMWLPDSELVTKVGPRSVMLLGVHSLDHSRPM